MASVRRRKLASGRTSWQVRGEGVETRSFVLKDDADRYRLDCERRRQLGDLYVEPPGLFGAALDRHLRLGATRWAVKTVEDRDDSAARLTPLRGVLLSQLRAERVEDLVAGIAAEAPRRAQNVLALVKAVLRDAEQRGQRVDRAVFGIRPPAYRPRPSQAVSYEQALRVSEGMPAHWWRFVPVAMLTGLRRGELLALTDSDLDLKAATLVVRSGKTCSAARTVHLPAEAVRLLRAQQLQRPPTVEGWLFPNLLGRRTDPATLSVAWRQARLDAGLPGLRIHDLRHSAVTLAGQAGWSVEHAREQFGWSEGTAAAMHARYRHVYGGEMAAQAAKIDVLLREASA